MITLSELKAFVTYNPDTGVFTRNIRPTNGRGYIGEPVGVPHNGYLRCHINKSHVFAHRLAWLWMTGEWPISQIDHINGIRSDNRWCNLRSADAFTNNHNRTKANKNNRSGFLGVKILPNNMYQARIRVNKKLITLGNATTAEEAHKLYLTAKRVLHAGNML